MHLEAASEFEAGILAQGVGDPGIRAIRRAQTVAI
jgi:hypothetical protein